MKKYVDLNKFNEFFELDEDGVEIGYGDRAMEFKEVYCVSFDDFCHTAEIGQCWTAKDKTYFKTRNKHGEAEGFYIDEDGDISTI